jgi:internalin A
MYLVCQHPPGPHPTEKGYTVREGAEWWIKLSPWLDHLMKFLKFGIPLGKAIGAVYDATEIDQIRTQIELMQAISDILPGVSKLDEMSSVVTLLNLSDEQQAMGPALRALYSFLSKADPGQIWGGLHKTLTPDGNILWLCDTHRKQYEARPLILSE